MTQAAVKSTSSAQSAKMNHNNLALYVFCMATLLVGGIMLGRATHNEMLGAGVMVLFQALVVAILVPKI